MIRYNSTGLLFRAKEEYLLPVSNSFLLRKAENSFSEITFPAERNIFFLAGIPCFIMGIPFFSAEIPCLDAGIPGFKIGIHCSKKGIPGFKTEIPRFEAEIPFFNAGIHRFILEIPGFNICKHFFIKSKKNMSSLIINNIYK